MISGFRREGAENCALLWYYSENRDFGTTYRSHPRGSRILFGFLNLRKRREDIIITRYLIRQKSTVKVLGILSSASIGQEMSP